MTSHRNLRIVITGNMGYVGPVVVRHLRSRFPDAHITGVDTGYFAHCLTSADILPECRLDRQIFADVRSFPLEILSATDALVLLAAISNDPMGNQFAEVTMDINQHATVNLVKAARDAGVRMVVFASSCSVYGLAEDSPRTEQSPVNPLTPYAKSKVLTEGALRTIAGKDCKVTCLRFATACGMSERLRLDLVLNDFVASAVATKRIDILSDGSPWRPLIDVSDMARALEWGIVRDPADGGDFVVVNTGADAWNYQVRDLAHAVANHCPGVSVSINPNAQPDKRSYRVDFSLFRSLAPDHQPQCTLLDSIRNLKAGLEAIHFQDAAFRESSLIRLKVLAKLCQSQMLDQELQWTRQTRQPQLAVARSHA